MTDFDSLQFGQFEETGICLISSCSPTDGWLSHLSLSGAPSKLDFKVRICSLWKDVDSQWNNTACAPVHWIHTGVLHARATPQEQCQTHLSNLWWSLYYLTVVFFNQI